VPADRSAHRVAPPDVIQIEKATDRRGRERLQNGRRISAASARLWRHLFQLAAIQRLRRRVAARRTPRPTAQVVQPG
jgi:hypothetical protein